MGTAAPRSPAIRTLSPDAEVTALLADCGLPVADLTTPPATLVLWGCRGGDGRIIATVGLEGTGPDVLLRSLAVAPQARGQGMAGRLLRFAEGQAMAAGATRIHLLTDSAAAYFARHAYGEQDRRRAPAAVRATAQFRELCPDSARYMTKTVTGTPA